MTPPVINAQKTLEDDEFDRQMALLNEEIAGEEQAESVPPPPPISHVNETKKNVIEEEKFDEIEAEKIRKDNEVKEEELQKSRILNRITKLKEKRNLVTDSAAEVPRIKQKRQRRVVTPFAESEDEDD